MTDAALTISDVADAHTVTDFRTLLSHWLHTHFALTPVRHNDVLLAVNEALTNAAEFAYGGGRGIVTMAACHRATERTLVVDVCDQGKWRHTKTRSNTRGRGIPLMQALADRATISPLATGTQVSLQFDDCAPIAAARYAASV